MSVEEFYELLRRCVVLTILGNHEKMSVLWSLYNVRVDKYLPVLLPDGEVVEYGGLRVAGISGIVSPRGGMKRGVPRKTPDEYLEAGQQLLGRYVDVLLVHEAPYKPNVQDELVRSPGAKVVDEVVELVKPRIVFNGHLHAPRFPPYKVYRYQHDSLYIRVDTSQRTRHYAVYHHEEGRVEIWHDKNLVEEVEV